MDGCRERTTRARTVSACRLPITVGANGYVRFDKPVEVVLDLRTLSQVAPRGGADPCAIQVVEVNHLGEVVDPAVVSQFDLDPECGARGSGCGTLAFVLTGVTPAEGVRHFEVRAGAEGAPAAAGVCVTEVADYQGQESFRIETATATYYYHKAGGGFASMLDPEGRDWISYRPGGGARGEYRGIPNVINPEGGLHPGSEMCTSRVVSQGPVRVSIRSESLDGNWAARWDIYPHHARFTMLKAGHPYWFLYEGTPAGRLDEQHQYWVRSDGERGSASNAWECPLLGSAWVYFGDSQVSERVIYLARHQADGHMDSYWPMQSAMTVFGFGRDNSDRARWSNLTRIPAQFSIGFAEGGRPGAVGDTIRSALQEVLVSVGAVGVG